MYSLDRSSARLWQADHTLLRLMKVRPAAFDAPAGLSNGLVLRTWEHIKVMLTKCNSLGLVSYRPGSEHSDSPS